MKLPLLALGQSHFKCSSVFPWSSEKTDLVLYYAKDYYPHSANPGFVGSLTGAYGSN